MIRDDLELLDALVLDEARQPDIFLAGNYWRPYQDRMLRHIRRIGISRFRSEPLISKGFSDCIGDVFDPAFNWKTRVIAALTRLPGLHGYVSDLRRGLAAAQSNAAALRGQLTARDFNETTCGLLREHGWPATDIGGTGAMIATEAGRASAHYIAMADRIGRFQKAAPCQSPATYMEIGGGFGAMAHLMMHWHPSIKTAILVDIPPVLYIATQFLKSFGPVCSYLDTRDLPTIRTSDHRVICIPPWQIEKLSAKVDLFHNAASLSEMPKETVGFYGRQVERLSHHGTVVWIMPNVFSVHASASVSLVDDITGAFGWCRPAVAIGDDMIVSTKP